MVWHLLHKGLSLDKVFNVSVAFTEGTLFKKWSRDTVLDKPQYRLLPTKIYHNKLNSIYSQLWLLLCILFSFFPTKLSTRLDKLLWFMKLLQNWIFCNYNTNCLPTYQQFKLSFLEFYLHFVNNLSDFLRSFHFHMVHLSRTSLRISLQKVFYCLSRNPCIILQFHFHIMLVENWICLQSLWLKRTCF